MVNLYRRRLAIRGLSCLASVRFVVSLGSKPPLETLKTDRPIQRLTGTIWHRCSSLLALGINHYPWSAVMRLTTKTLAPFALSLIGLVAIACCGSAAAPSSLTAPTPTATSAGVAAAIGRYLRGRRRIPRGASRLLLACRGYAGRGRCGLCRPAAGGLSCNSWRGPASNTNVRTRWIRCRRASDRSMLDRSSDRPRKLNSSKWVR